MGKFNVFVSQAGYIEVEAESKDAALERVLLMTGEDVDWDSHWTVNDIQERKSA